MTFPLAPSEPGLTSRLCALIGEARRRARRRRARYGAFVLASLSLAGGLFFQIHRGYLSHYRNSVKGATELGTVLVAKRMILKGASGSSIAAQNLFVVRTVPKVQMAPTAIRDPGGAAGTGRGGGHLSEPTAGDVRFHYGPLGRLSTRRAG
jgi:hypothetical protein